MGLLQRVKGWFSSPSSRGATEHAIGVPVAGPAVAGFVQRLAADVEFVIPANRERSLAVLMPPKVAAATPLRTIPLFLVPAAVEPAEVEIVHAARPAPMLQVVHNIDWPSAEKPVQVAAFQLAARLASVAHLNTRTGRQPAKPATRTDAATAAKNRAKAPNRPTAEPVTVAKRGAAGPSNNKSQCFVRPQSAGAAAVSAVPPSAKRRVA